MQERAAHNSKDNNEYKEIELQPHPSLNGVVTEQPVSSPLHEMATEQPVILPPQYEREYTRANRLSAIVQEQESQLMAREQIVGIDKCAILSGTWGVNGLFWGICASGCDPTLPLSSSLPLGGGAGLYCGIFLYATIASYQCGKKYPDEVNYLDYMRFGMSPISGIGAGSLISALTSVNPFLAALMGCGVATCITTTAYLDAKRHIPSDLIISNVNIIRSLGNVTTPLSEALNEIRVIKDSGAHNVAHSYEPSIDLFYTIAYSPLHPKADTKLQVPNETVDLKSCIAFSISDEFLKPKNYDASSLSIGVIAFNPFSTLELARESSDKGSDKNSRAARNIASSDTELQVPNEIQEPSYKYSDQEEAKLFQNLVGNKKAISRC